MQQYTIAMTEQEGCYLLFHNDSGGRLELQYSKAPVEKAIAYWQPGEGKKIQGKCQYRIEFILNGSSVVCDLHIWWWLEMI